MGAAPRKNVIRENSDPGDIIILMGGRTGRDGCGGATGSSKAHTTESIHVCGAEVQKGNAPTERKLQRLFRREEVAHLIKKCNDFGAGGVSVAIGELADGLRVQLDKVPKKYAGLDGTELAISESQERMAIVVDKKDVDKMLAFAKEENLEAVVVAEVTKEPRLVLVWRGKEIVNISRAFLDTNGAHQEATAVVAMPDETVDYFKTGAAYEAVAVKKQRGADGNKESLAGDAMDGSGRVSKGEGMVQDGGFDLKSTWLSMLADLNICSKKGLVEMFDSSIGAATVTMPYGGKYQMTPVQTMVAKLPVLSGSCDTVTMMSYGYDPYLSSWSPYHGAMYAVVSSVAKIVAAGGDYTKIRFTFQEYFRRLGTDPKHWGEPLSALLGAYEAQLRFGLPSIGGKDSMSGSFNEINVPPTLVSFAVDIAKTGDVVTPELKKAGNALVRFTINKDEYGLPKFDQMMGLYAQIHQLMRAGVIISAYALGAKGIAEAVSKMAFGNRLGVELCNERDPKTYFLPEYGNLIAEVAKEDVKKIEAAGVPFDWFGMVTDVAEFKVGDVAVPMGEALSAWENTLEKVFPMHSGAVDEAQTFETKLYDVRKMAGTGGAQGAKVPVAGQASGSFADLKKIYTSKNRVAKPHVFIPVFPGTNCEYDTQRAFERAGATVNTVVFKNLDEQCIRESVEAFEKAIRNAQILMFPGGFSAGDEPDGSGKFIATAFRNVRIADAVNDLLKQKDGLVLGICNGFQAIIKLGLVPYGEITAQLADSPTLATNNIGRHISKSVYTKVVTNKSPWLMKAELGGIYSVPASHGEGRFVASEGWLKKLAENGQIATQYVDLSGSPTMEEAFNPNGSYYAIEGITSPDGRVLGKMAHSERRGDAVAVNIAGEQNQYIFESGVAYFR